MQLDTDILSMWCGYFCTSGFMSEGQINIVLHNDQRHVYSYEIKLLTRLSSLISSFHLRKFVNI